MKKNWRAFFKEISQIPRCSGEEQALASYLYQFGREKGLKTQRDEADNVLLTRAPSPGYEEVPGLILQAHMDMVCVKDRESAHRFSKDPLTLVEKDGFLSAKGTTLGADNGAGLAMILALLDDETLRGPQIEAVFTAGEEQGLVGAMALNTHGLTGQYLINLDGEKEGLFIASCAGGVRAQMDLEIDWRQCPPGESYRLIIDGLKGGHSGLEVHHERANALVLLGRVLAALREERIGVYSATGGEQANAIAHWAEVGLVIDRVHVPRMRRLFESMEKRFVSVYGPQDPKIHLRLEKDQRPERVYSRKTRRALMQLLTLSPQGILRKHPLIEGLVETSSNPGLLCEESGHLLLKSAIRSEKEEQKRWILSQMEILAKAVGATCHASNDYSAWRYREQSKLRDLVLSTYQEMGGSPEVATVHAGLECGVLLQKMPSVDALSFGPHIEGAHTTREALNLASAERVYQLLVEVIGRAKHL